MEYIEMSEEQLTLGAFMDNKLIGVISVNKSSRINFIFVENSFRNSGIGTNLLLKAVEELKLSKITMGLPNNASIHGFLKHLDFEKDKLSQFEMYFTL
jgi:ribosomal protein S18 acetylase RimI-like enzyme